MSTIFNPDGTPITEKYERQGWPAITRPELKPPAGWSLPLITAVNRIHHHRLSPDGQTIAFVWDREGLSDLYRMPTRGGWPERLTMNRAPVSYWTDESPQWSLDGQWLAVSLEGQVQVVAAASPSLPRPISSFTRGASSPVWLPDSQRLVITIERDEKSQLLLTDRDGSWPGHLVTTPGDAWDAQPSPDGRFVCFTHRPLTDLNRLDVWLVEVATGQLRELTGTPKVNNWGGRWSPDGQTIAFISQQSGWNEVWLGRPDGEGVRQLTHLGQDVADLAWSPDGGRIACTVNEEGAYHLGLLDAQTGDVTFLRREFGLHSRPHWSPDGAFLTFEYEDWSRPPDLYRLELDSGRVTQLTFSNPPALASRPLVKPEIIRYPSYDGLEIPAFLYRPTTPNGAAIVHPHGGPSAQYDAGWDILAQYFIAKGYTWLAPNYRGSTGYGLAFERANYHDWGVGDTQDCLHGATYLSQQPGVDRERIAIYGGSYGGYMTVCCLSRDPEYRFACGINKYGDSNTLSSWAQCNRDLRLYSEIFLGHPAQNRATYQISSPIHQVDQVQKPVLILHGLLDTVVPPQAAEEWVEALRRAGKTFEYKTYAGEGHGFLSRATQLDAYSRMERFLDWYLLP